MEDDACLEKTGVVAGEIIGLKEEADAAAGLVADRGALGIIRGFGEQEGRALPAPWADHQPALALGLDRVFQAFETEAVTIEGLGAIIGVDDQTDEKEAVSAHNAGLSVRTVTQARFTSRLRSFSPGIEGLRQQFQTRPHRDIATARNRLRTN
jgi:hypothetical protein